MCLLVGCLTNLPDIVGFLGGLDSITILTRHYIYVVPLYDVICSFNTKHTTGISSNYSISIGGITFIFQYLL